MATSGFSYGPRSRSLPSRSTSLSSGSPVRREWIAQQVLARGSIEIDDVVAKFGVTRMTVHRDLDELEGQGLIRKVRNGATAQPSNLFESDVRYRILQQREAKALLARTAVNFIEPGSSILLDEATTLLPLIDLLPSVGPLTVISNFLPLLQAARRHENLRVICLGGELLGRFDSFTGLICERSASALSADLFFTSSTAISGITVYHPDEQVVRVKRVLMNSAKQRYLLADHTKFGKTALHKFSLLTDFTAVIVDDQLDRTTLKQLRKAGVRVVLARRGHSVDSITIRKQSA